ncbi:MAG: 6-phosphogluconolactonase, partial [Chloroflexota bacterium]
MAPQVAWDLRVVTDVAAAAAELFWAERPRSVVLSGGATPRPLYHLLAAHPERHPWAATHVFFGDERCVPPGHPGSNYRMACEALLSQVPATAHPMPGETCDAEEYEAELRAFFCARPAAFDLTLLGMGEDGHTASLFPGGPALGETERWVVRAEAPDHPRLTL